jgi:hypothetical protein
MWATHLPNMGPEYYTYPHSSLVQRQGGTVDGLTWYAQRRGQGIGSPVLPQHVTIPMDTYITYQ